MALGNNYDSNKKNQQYSPTVYSNYNVANSESSVDPSALGYQFWNEMLTISISPRKNTGNPDNVEYDHDNAIKAYLNHTKARMLENEILGFLKDPVKFNSSGVLSNNKLVTISNGSEFGTNGMFLVIRQLNLETLEVESSYAYQFKTEYHYSVRNFDAEKKSFDKVLEDFSTIEVQQLLTVLHTYYESMTNAVAYSVIDQSRFNNSRINTKLDSIAEKLGVEYKSHSNNGSYSKKSSNSAFDKAPAARYSSASLDDVENSINEALED